MRLNFEVATILAVTMLLATGCGQQDQQSYFPLDSDISWLYTIKTRLVHGETIQKLHLSNIGKDKTSNDNSYIQQSITGARTYYKITESGINRYQLIASNEQALEQHYLTQTVYNHPIEVGTSWDDVITTSLLANPDLEARDIIEAVPVKVTITSTEEFVSVAAGSFSYCLKIESIGKKFIARGKYAYQDDMTITTKNTRWYAKGIGLIKEEHEEISDMRLFPGGSYTKELEKFNG